MEIGKRVRIKSTATKHYGRTGIVVKFNPSFAWFSPRALLAPEMCICVHLEPKSKLERRKGSPVTMMFPHEIEEIDGKPKQV